MNRAEADRIARDARFDVALEEGLRELANRPEGGRQRWPWRRVAAAAALVAGLAWVAARVFSDSNGTAPAVAETEVRPAPRLVEAASAADMAAAEAALLDAAARDEEAAQRTIAALDFFMLPEFKTGGGRWGHVMGQLAGAFEDPAKRRPAELTEREGIATSPHPPHSLVDVRGFAPGETVVDPMTDLPFRVPEKAGAQDVPPPEVPSRAAGLYVPVPTGAPATAPPGSGEPEIRFVAPGSEGEENATRIPSADLRNVSVWDALRYLAARSAYEVVVVAGDVTVVPMDGPDVMVERELSVPAGFGGRPLAALGSEAPYLPRQVEPDAARDPFIAPEEPADETRQDGRTRAERLRDWGLTFPEGTTLEAGPEGDRYFVANTRRNVALLEALAGLANAGSQIFITTKVIMVPEALLGDQDLIIGVEDSIPFLKALSESAGFALLSAPSLVTRNGQAAMIEMTSETDLGDEGISTPDGSANFAGIQTIGLNLSIDPTFDGDLVKLDGGILLRDVLGAEPPESLSEFYAGIRSTFGLPQPVAEHGIDFEVWMADGQSAMLKIFELDGGRALWCFLTGRRIDPAGQPIRKLEQGPPR